MKDIYIIDFFITLLLTFLNIFGYISMRTSGNPDSNFLLLLFGTFFLLIYIFVKSIIEIRYFIKCYRNKEIRFEIKKLLITIPYVLIYCFFTIRFLYESKHFFDWFYIPRIIISPIAFIGNLLWFYYWIFVNRLNISKLFLKIYNSIYMVLLIIFIDPSILFFYEYYFK